MIGSKLLPIDLRILPGGLFALALAATANLLGILTPLPPVFTALVLGLLLAPFCQGAAMQPGLDFSTRTVLRIGVALLGAQVTFEQLRSLGVEPFLLAVLLVIVSLAFGYALARRVGLSTELAWLSAGAVAICGASAAMAIAAVLPKSRTLEHNATACIAGITVIGTIGMFVYPALADVLAFSPAAAGMFMGASLHEVVQAAGAGLAISEDAGEVATTVKLVRVACLGPIVLLISWRMHAASEANASARVPLLPFFLVAFVALSVASSLGAVPASMLPPLQDLSRFLLLVAIGALGLKVSVTKFAALGPKPPLVLTGQTLILAGMAALGLLLLDIR